LVGTQEEEELAVSQQIKTNFIQHARKDESSGELYMTEDEFIDAIAPKHQDYVSIYNQQISMLFLMECASAQNST
jgi:solute carrier family 25 aspartate/glutamate transporter 12/13